jgi:RNA polymerase sigma-70 factor (ECF subfamily)
LDVIDQLVIRLKDGDVEAFQELHRRYAENILGAINIIVQDESIAEEICQDVFVKVWERSKSYNSKKGRFFTWLLNIARNAAIDCTRSKSFKAQKKNHSLDFFVNIYDKPAEPDKAEEDYTRLKRMLNTLKRKCVELIELLYFQEYSQTMVAELLSIPVGTVKSRNRNCLKQLREQMENEY